MIACLRIPYFPAAVEGRDNPALVGQPLAIGQPVEAPQEVYAVSREAAGSGVHPGLTMRQAQAYCPEVEIIPAAPLRYRRVAEALQAHLAEFGDQVEIEDRLALRASARQLKKYAYYLHPSQVDEQPAAVFYLDLGKLTGEQAEGIATHINQIIDKHFRLTPSLALAEGKFTARVAATSLTSGEVFVVPRRDNASFLARFPVSLLPVDGETVRQLHLLGLTTLGQLAALPAATLQERFGSQGKTMHRLANGRDTSPVGPYTPPIVERLTRQLEGAVEDRQVMDRVVAEMLGELVARLGRNGHAARELELTLRLDDGTRLERAILLRRPGADPDHLAHTAQALLESLPVSSGIAEVEVGLAGIGPAAARQLSLFEREPVPQARLRDVLQELVARYGEDHFYWVQLNEGPARLPERRFQLKKVSDS